ncbi:hypothetical protein PS15m_001376 [Mucor circinelloides]
MLRVNRALTISGRRRATVGKQEDLNRVFALLYQQMDTQLRSKIQKRMKDQGEIEALKSQHIALTQLESGIVSGDKQVTVQAQDFIQTS